MKSLWCLLLSFALFAQGGATPPPTLEALTIEIRELARSQRRLDQELNLLGEELERHLVSRREKQGEKEGGREFQALFTRQQELEERQVRIVADLSQLNHLLHGVKQELHQQRAELASLEETYEQKIEMIRGNLVELLALAKGKSVIHRVLAGETLGSIAQDHHCSVDALKQANSLKSDRIYAGQELKLP